MWCLEICHVASLISFSIIQMWICEGWCIVGPRWEVALVTCHYVLGMNAFVRSSGVSPSKFTDVFLQTLTWSSVVWLSTSPCSANDQVHSSGSANVLLTPFILWTRLISSIIQTDGWVWFQQESDSILPFIWRCLVWFFFYNNPSDVAMHYEFGCEICWFLSGLQLSASSNS